MKAWFAHYLSASDRRIVCPVDSLRPSNLKYAWMVLATFLCLWALAEFEPETAEAVNSTIGIGAIACVLWGIWQLMQYDR
jgi:hypothetical protein